MLKINAKYKKLFTNTFTPRGLHKEEYQGCHPNSLLSRGGTALSSEHNNTFNWLSKCQTHKK